ncbi:MAG TPA: hypothetical protein VMY59_00865 [Candidatus Thermoplasmatota archaeon]|nr:hypothetical protein [Candidatus Thermoplasmatota archaeon]
MENIETDKLTETYTLRLPEVLKVDVDRLPSILKKKMHHRILIVMAEAVHESKFDPNIYLKTL